MVGTPRYERNALDFYPTPKRCVDALKEVIGEDLPTLLAWEPFCGDGAISKEIGPECRGLISTDIRAYPGFDPDGLLDFFSVRTDAERAAGELMAPSLHDVEKLWPPVAEAVEAADQRPLEGLRPDAIISNPPYGELAQGAIERALKLMEPENGMVVMLLRAEYDAGRKRAHLFRDHPAFRAKVQLLFRPRWIADSTGAPRHNYAWFCWDWTRPAAMKPELLYAG